MKILNIAKIIILRELRDVNIMLLMCAMPIAIIFILGLVFNSLIGSGSGSFSLDDMNITYAVIGEESQLSTELENLMDNMLSEGSTYIRNDDEQSQIELLKESKITAFILIDEVEQQITLYKNSMNNTSSSIIESAVRSFVAKYNIIVEIASVNPGAVGQMLSDDGQRQYIAKTGLQEKYQPSAMDYYGVSITALFVLYGFLSPLLSMINDRKDKLALRISVTSVNPAETFLGTVLGYVTVACIRLGIVITITKLLFHINWGENPLFPFLLLFAMITFVTSIGMVLGQIFKTEAAASPVAHSFIIASAFFGGAYVTLDNMGPLGVVGKFFSLIWWVNTGIMNQIYNNNYSYMKTAFVIFIAGTLLLLGISVLLMNRKEVYAND